MSIVLSSKSQAPRTLSPTHGTGDTATTINPNPRSAKSGNSEFGPTMAPGVHSYCAALTGYRHADEPLPRPRADAVENQVVADTCTNRQTVLDL